MLAKLRLAIVLFALSGVALSAQSTPSKIFSVLESPAGWKLPPLGSPVRGQVSYPIDLSKFGVNTSAFNVRESFDLPYVYETSDGTVVISATHASAKSIFALERNGEIFGYCALVFDKETTAAFRVWWIDPNGSGKFTKLLRSNEFPGNPLWVR